MMKSKRFEPIREIASTSAKDLSRVMGEAGRKVADLEHNGELDIVFTAPEENGTYALRSGHRGKPGGAPWPMTRGNISRTNCAPW